MRLVKIMGYILQGGLAALVCMGIGLFVAGKYNIIEPYSGFVILSGSMSPAIPVGGVVLVQHQPWYSVGDVISFAQNEKTNVTHRIAGVSESETYFGEATYTTKGDANTTVDGGTVSQANVQGKVLVTIPYLGYLIEFAKSPKGFLLLIVIPATIVVYEELKNMGKELRKTLERIATRFKRTKNEEGAPEYAIESRNNTARLFTYIAIIPIAAASSFFATQAGAYFFDQEHSLSNVLGAATNFGEKTASLYNSDPYTCPDGASNTAGTVFGIVAIKLVGGVVKVDVKLTGATPLSSYDIWVNQDPGACPLSSPTAPAVLTTDGSGNGVAHVETAFVPGATKFWISAVGGSQVLRSVAVSLP